MSRVLITGGAGFLGSHLADLMLSRGHEVICMDNFVTGSPSNIAHLLRQEGLPVHRARRHELHLRRRAARLHPALRLAREPDRLPPAPDPDAQGRLARHAQGARPREGKGRAVPPRLDERGLRRPARAPAARDLLGQRESGRARAASTTRRSASPRRSRWPTTARTACGPASCGSSTPTGRGCG